MYLLKMISLNLSTRKKTAYYRSATGITSNIKNAKIYRVKSDILYDFNKSKKKYKNSTFEIVIKEDFIFDFLGENNCYSF